MAIGDLAEQARVFADEQSQVLNRTVTSGIRLGSSIAPVNGTAHIGFRVTRSNIGPEPFPLDVGPGPPKCFLLINQVQRLDDAGEHLADGRTSYAVYHDAEAERPLLRLDYVRNNRHHAEAHFHVESEFVHGDPEGVKPARKLHFPVGGRRFRPCLEDLIEFLVRENFAQGRDGWEAAVEEGRTRWFEKQLRASIRRNPEIARDAVRQLAD